MLPPNVPPESDGSSTTPLFLHWDFHGTSVGAQSASMGVPGYFYGTALFPWDFHKSPAESTIQALYSVNRRML